MGKGSKGGYYSSRSGYSGSGGGDDCGPEEQVMWVGLSAMTGWIIFCLVFSIGNVPNARHDMNYPMHSGEMRIISLPRSGPLTESVTTINNLENTPRSSGFHVHYVSGEPPIASNATARTFPAVHETYSFPEDCDWWYQNVWLPAGSTISLTARCTASDGTSAHGIATIQTIPENLWSPWWDAAGCGSSSTPQDYTYEYKIIPYLGEGVTAVSTISYTRPVGATGQEWYVAINKYGKDVSCTMDTTFSLVPYDLSGVAAAIYSKTGDPNSADDYVDVDSSKSPYVLLVSDIPTSSAAIWSDFIPHMSQKTRPAVKIGPWMGYLFGGLALCIAACYFSVVRVDAMREKEKAAALATSDAAKKAAASPPTPTPASLGLMVKITSTQNEPKDEPPANSTIHAGGQNAAAPVPVAVNASAELSAVVVKVVDTPAVAPNAPPPGGADVSSGGVEMQNV